jgi:hypothetical protein
MKVEKPRNRNHDPYRKIPTFRFGRETDAVEHSAVLKFPKNFCDMSLQSLEISALLEEVKRWTSNCSLSQPTLPPDTPPRWGPAFPGRTRTADEKGVSLAASG